MNIGIISLGLIGGSLLKALCKIGFDLFVVSSNVSTMNKALAYTDNVSIRIESLSTCDIVFVCSPISETINMLDKLETVLAPSAIVADVASVKEFVMQKKRPYKFIGSHPMAGTEKSGFDASFAELFEQAKWVLTPSDDVPQQDITLISDVLRQTGANPIITDAKAHDQAVALISHLPMVLAQTLFNSAKNNKLALQLAASGFRDMTRLAMSNTQMALDMLNYNGENIQKAYNNFTTDYEGLISSDFKVRCEEISILRADMYNENGKNNLV